MNDYSMFKRALNGFDKDEVLSYIQKRDDQQAKRIEDLEKKFKSVERENEMLKERLSAKENRISRLEHEIETKYQPYIDNYQQIGELIYSSKIKGDQIVSDARLEADKLLADADREADRRVNTAQGEIKARLDDGRKQYQKIRTEITDVVTSFHTLQKKFRLAYQDMNEIIEAMPGSLDESYVGAGADDLDEGLYNNIELKIPLDDLDLDEDETEDGE